MKLILHLLHDDEPNGPRIARIDQWSGRALCLPRGEVEKEIAKHPELSGPCFYFLLNPGGTGSVPRVYVGEADGFRDRVKSHLKEKEWWTSLVIFFSRDDSLTKSGIQYLESRCVAKLREAGWCDVVNGNVPGLPSVPAEDVGGLELFLKNVSILMPVVGYNIFAAAPASVEGAEEPPQPAPPSFDTIVCPAHDDGFASAFLGQRAWWAIRIAEANLSKIKYIAIYRVAPISAITHYGEVERIEPYLGGGKYKLFLKGVPVELPHHIGVGTNIHIKPQGPKYALLSGILSAKSLDDVFGK